MNPRLTRPLRQLLAATAICGTFAQADTLNSDIYSVRRPNFGADEALSRGLSDMNTALRGQVERQLRAIRNRMTSMQGGMPCYPPDPKAPMVEPLPYTLWANAELDYHHLRDDNTLPGYKLRSIGGTGGISMLAAPELTVGAAFSGMAGRLSSKGSGSDVSGDLDAYYASIFMRKDSGCVQHSLIGTVGWADFSYNRHINHPRRSMATHGSTDGLGLGIMYEVARTYKLSADSYKSAWWQPVFNVTYVHSKVDSFTEQGDYTSVRVAKQDSNNVIFGLGARMQGIVGEQFLNTPAVMEARVLGKAVTGARRGKAQISIPGTDLASTVRGAEAGPVGVELGIGFNIPLGMKAGAIITDFTAEFYRNQTSVNGTLGYRLDF